MNVRTIEDGFEYQITSVFEDMLEDYNIEQEILKSSGKSPETFADWLWKNKGNFGERVFIRFDEYAGIDDATKDLNNI